MKKSLVFILTAFLVFGILASSFILSDDDRGLNPNVSGGHNVQIEQRVEGDSIINGSQVHMNREIQVEDGKTTIQIEKTIKYGNGTEVEISIHIKTENQNGTLVRSMDVEKDGEDFNVSVDNKLEVEDEIVGNQSQIIANLSNGSSVDINVLPDEAMQKALEELKLSNLTFANGTKALIKLEEKVHKNIPRVVYNIEGDKPGKFFGIFKLSMRVSTEVDSETGNIVSVNQPWWAFLVVSPESTGSTITNSTTNLTNAS